MTRSSCCILVVVSLLSSCRDADTTPAAGCAGVSLSTDPANCGACGRACGANERCAAGTCEAACLIDGVSIDAGTVPAANACVQCVPGTSSTAYTPRADGTACGSGQVCGGGTCSSQCFIAGVLRAESAVNPDNTCEHCDPTRSTTSWSARGDGTTCAAGEVCAAGVCQARCFIDGGVVSANELDPGNVCRQCNPAASTSDWSLRADGVSCASGQICQAGACAARCFIGGDFYAPDATHAGNLCEVCDPARSTSGFSFAADGTACGTGQVCASGTCAAKCFIGGVLFADGASDPQNPCQVCAASSSTTSWSLRATGFACGTGRVCEGAACVAKCFIGGTLQSADEVNPTQHCESCQPAVSTAAWSPRASVSLLVGGQDLAAQGWTVVSQAPFSLDAGTDFTRLATRTNTGASSSGQLLITRAGVVDGGAPFTLRAEVLVESVTPHNQFDMGAGILGAFTPPFGVSTQRSQMVYLDAAAIGWGDDTQSAALAVTNNAYRTYVIAVDAMNTARVSVDGVPLLTRANFVSNGTFALGDQTNDPNVDGVMRIRSVSRVCP